MSKTEQMAARQQPWTVDYEASGQRWFVGRYATQAQAARAAEMVRRDNGNARVRGPRGRHLGI